MILVARIAKRISNPDLTAKQKLELAAKWAACVRLVAGMHGMTPEQVQDIVEKFQDEEDKGILWEDAFEPETFKTQEERIFWDYILECEMLEGR